MAVLFQPSRSRRETSLVTSLWTTWQPDSAGLSRLQPRRWLEGPFSGARSFQKPTRRRSLLPPLPYLPTHRGPELVLLHITGLGNKTGPPPHLSDPQAEAGAAGRAQAAAISQPGPRPAWPTALPGLHKPVRRMATAVSQTRKLVLGGAQGSKGAKKPADAGPHVYPEGDPWTAGPAGPQVPCTSYPGFCRHLAPVPHAHTERALEEAVCEVPFGPRMESVCCSSSGQSPLNKNNPHVLVFV